MIEVIIRQYLINAEIEGIGNKVYMETPEEMPEEYIVIEKTGSGEQDHIESAMIAIQSRSRNRLENAANINEAVKEAMKAMPYISDEVYSCKLNSDYNFTDARTKEYRYQAVFNIYF